ncbi:MAG: hypothetical protein FWC32_03925 [Firmicutes bacterium]|nr:hypothetical protein [Bacillota bacterium]
MDKRAMEDLNIPHLLHEICPNEKVINHMEAYLRNLEQDKSVITERQREIADILNNQELVSILTRMIRRLDELKEQHKMERKSAFKSRSHATHSEKKDQLAAVMDSIPPVVRYAEECIKLYRDLPVYVKDFSFTSDVFIKFKELLIKTTEGEKIKQLLTFFNELKKLEVADVRHNSEFSITFAMDEKFNKLSCRISELIFKVNPILSRPRITMFEPNFLKMLRRSETARRKEDFEKAEAFFSHSIKESLTYIADLIFMFTQNLQRPLERIQKDLPLYEFGLSLARHYKTRNIPFCFPRILDPGKQTRIKWQHETEPQPLMIMFSGDGDEYFLFLQKYALLQLFAQAGLPVAAQEADVAIVSGLFVQFASSELILGRFEEEAKEMSAICSKIKPHGLVILHEVFQSTSYEEIAEPFTRIINYLSNLPCTVLVVTHNNFLAEQQQSSLCFSGNCL